MTVKELITRLQEMPQDAQVFIFGDQFWQSGGYTDMSEAYIEYHDESDPDGLPGQYLPQPHGGIHFPGYGGKARRGGKVLCSFRRYKL